MDFYLGRFVISENDAESVDIITIPDSALS